MTRRIGLACGVRAVMAIGTSVPAPLAQTGADDRVAKRYELARARALWRAHGARDYRFRIVVRCFCPQNGMPTTVTVRDGLARGASGFATRLRTGPLMFTPIQSVLNDPAAGDVADASLTLAYRKP